MNAFELARDGAGVEAETVVYMYSIPALAYVAVVVVQVRQNVVDVDLIVVADLAGMSLSPIPPECWSKSVVSDLLVKIC
jgi:hypothetical protein